MCHPSLSLLILIFSKDKETDSTDLIQLTWKCLAQKKVEPSTMSGLLHSSHQAYLDQRINKSFIEPVSKRVAIPIRG